MVLWTLLEKGQSSLGRCSQPLWQSLRFSEDVMFPAAILLHLSQRSAAHAVSSSGKQQQPGLCVSSTCILCLWAALQKKSKGEGRQFTDSPIRLQYKNLSTFIKVNLTLQLTQDSDQWRRHIYGDHSFQMHAEILLYRWSPVVLLRNTIHVRGWASDIFRCFAQYVPIGGSVFPTV